MQKLRNLVTELKAKLSPEAGKELDNLTALPEVKAVFAREEEAVLEARRELIAQLHEVPDKHQKRALAFAKLAQEAEQRVKRAEAELRAAREAHAKAAGEALGAGLPIETETAELTRQLIDGADPRLQDFIDASYWLRSSVVRHAVVVWPSNDENWLTLKKAVTYESNQQEVRACWDLMEATEAEARAAQLEALTHREATARLRRWAQRISGPLAALGADLIAINEAGEVKLQREMTTLELVEQTVSKAKGAGKRAVEA